MTSPKTDAETLRRDSLVLFGVLSVAYILLRSPIYIGDAVRWLPSVTADSIPTESGGARHYLFRWFAWLVYHAGNALGLANDSGPVLNGAIAVVQGANALLAAGTVVVTYHLLRLSVSRVAALVGVAFLACSNAFVLHATNMTEPVSSLIPALLGVYLVARTPTSRAVRILSGVLVGFATTVYLITAVTVAPAAWFALTRGARPGAPVPLWKRLQHATEHLAPAGLSFVAIIVFTELCVHPERGLAGALRHPFDFGLYGIYGQLRLQSLVGALFGFANSLYPFPPSEGMARLFRLPPASVATILVVAALGMTLLAGIAWRVYVARKRLLADGRWVEIGAGVVWFLAVYVVAVYFLPGYDKFWLFSGFAIALLVGVTLDDALTSSAASAPAGSGWQAKSALLFVVPGLVLLVANICFSVVPRRFKTNLDVVAAVSLSERIAPNDLLVCRGWDGPSAYMTYALKRPLECLSLVDKALQLGRSQDRFSDVMEERMRQARASGGRVYFLGVLEVPLETWQLFFGSELRLPYEMFEPYRREAVQIKDASLAAVNVKLFELPPQR